MKQPPNIYSSTAPVVQCNPPCTLVLPPYVLPSKTTITWPDLTTTLLSVSGGSSSTVTSAIDIWSGGSIIKTTTQLVTVYGGSTATVTTTVSVPPFTTDVIMFWPVTVDSAQPGEATPFVPEPSVRPPPISLSLKPGEYTIRPTHYPGIPDYQLPKTEQQPSSTTSDTLGFPLLLPPTGVEIPVYPMPTFPIVLPTKPFDKPWPCWPFPIQDCPKLSTTASALEHKTWFWPSAITFSSGTPTATCRPGQWCGKLVSRPSPLDVPYKLTFSRTVPYSAVHARPTVVLIKMTMTSRMMLTMTTMMTRMRKTMTTEPMATMIQKVMKMVMVTRNMEERNPKAANMVVAVITVVMVAAVCTVAVVSAMKYPHFSY